MKEPWRTLFAGYEAHWLIGQFIDTGRDEPDLARLAEDDRLAALSDGELILVGVGFAMAGLQRGSRIGDLPHLDVRHRRRVLHALELWLCEDDPGPLDLWGAK